MLFFEGGRRQELDGNGTFQAGVFGQIDYSHPASAELPLYFVMRNGLTFQVTDYFFPVDFGDYSNINTGVEL